MEFDNLKTYYILTSKKKKNILITKNYLECFDFIVKNKGTRIRTINYTAKPKILNRIEFFRSFYKNTDDLNKLFQIVDATVNGDNNKLIALKALQIYSEYKEFRKINQEFSQ